ncbi:unnamed protein product [Arabidopsis halleri]
MAASIVSSIILFLLFIILSLFVDGHVFAAQMEHRKLGGAKETMTLRKRNLEENGGKGSKIRTPPSMSRHSGMKNNQDKPTETHPAQARTKTVRQNNFISYDALKKPVGASNACNMYQKCKRESLAP